MIFKRVFMRCDNNRRLERDVTEKPFIFIDIIESLYILVKVNPLSFRGARIKCKTARMNKRRKRKSI